MNYRDEDSQVMEIRDRVGDKVSNTEGRLEDHGLDLDARTLALLGRREKLQVRYTEESAPLFTILSARLTALNSESLGECRWWHSRRPC